MIFLTAATSPSSGWLQIPPINNYSNIHSSSRPSFHSLLRLPRRSSQLQSSRDDNEERSTANSITTGSGSSSDQLQLRIGKRVGSGAYGTVHIAHSDDSDDESRYIAKRAWTLSELELNVPMAVMQLDNKNSAENNNQRTGVVCATGLAEQDNTNDDDDSDTTDNSSNNTDKLKETAARCQYYWNVERHIVQKLASSTKEGGDAINDSYVTPQFKGVYQSAPINDNDDNDDGGEIVPGYGTINKLDSDSVDDNNNNQGMGAFFSMFSDGDDDNQEGLCHEWMVFEYIPSPLLSDEESLLPAMTLLDAMGVSHSAFPYLYFTHSPR